MSMIVNLNPNLIDKSPLNPRVRMDEEGLEDLVGSIKERGLLQHLGAREKDDGRYELVWGERRWTASCRACLEEVPVKLLELSDKEAFELMVIENVSREDLTVVEEAKAYKKMIEEFGYTQSEVASRMNISTSRLSRVLDVNKFDSEVQEALEKKPGDEGYLPLYAVNVAAQLGDSFDRHEALKLAREANGPRSAKKAVDDAFLRPQKESEEWAAMEVRGGWDEGVVIEKATYEESRRIFPHLADRLIAFTAEGFVLAEEVPSDEMLGENTPDKKWRWGDYAEILEVPLKAVVDGNMKLRHLVSVSKLLDADLNINTFVLTLKDGCLNIEGGYELVDVSRFMFMAAEGALGGPGSSYQGNYLPDIEEPGGVSLVEGEFRVFPPEEGGLRLGGIKTESGASVKFSAQNHEWPFYGVRLCGCHFRQEFEGLRDLATQGEESVEVRDEVSDEEVEARRCKMKRMLQDLDDGVRSTVREGLVVDASLLVVAASALHEIGIAGFDQDESPFVKLLNLLGIPEDEEGLVMSCWPGFASTREGYESGVVCAWVYYWMESAEEPEDSNAWKRALEVYCES